MKRMLKGTLSMALAVVLLCSSIQMHAGAAISGKTGIGLAEWSLRAYNEKWKYVYGKAEVGKVDCSGLVRSYCNGQGGGATTMLNSYSSTKGSISSMPRVHGLVLYASGSNPPNTAHMGVYAGKNENGVDMVVDARSASTGVVYSTLTSRKNKPWTQWMKSSLVSYPTTGWYKFNGKTYYYKNGQFVVGTYTVDGVKYDFGKSGALKGETTGGSSSNNSSNTTVKKTTAANNKTTAAQSSTSLKLGAKGDAVKKLQKRLIELGYLKGNADGTFGQATEIAVKAFQKQMGLTVDGVAGPGTQKRLYASDAPKATATKTTTPQKTTTAASTKKTTASSTEKTTQATSSTTKSVSSENSDLSSLSHTEEVLRSRNLDPTRFRNVQFGMQGDNVLEVQNRLIELGYFDQDATGYYGAFTETAVKDFQSVCGLTATGEVNMETYVKMFEENALAKPESFVDGDDSGDAPDGGDLVESEITIEHNGENIIIEKEIYLLISESAFM